MGYNKIIISGEQIELYEYQYKCNAVGRPRGYKNVKKRENLADSGDSALLKVQQKRREDNARRTCLDFRRLVLANIRGGDCPLLCTFTFSDNRTSVRECARLYQLFIKRLRDTYKDFKYVAVVEFQKRGRVHYHALFWGLPLHLAERERKTREIAKIWGYGFVDCHTTDGSGKLASYLSKYMMKSIYDPRLIGKKLYFTSRNISRPVVNRGFPRWWAEDEYGLSTDSALLVKEYHTQWLGRGRYTLFNNID